MFWIYAIVGLSAVGSIEFLRRVLNAFVTALVILIIVLFVGSIYFYQVADNYIKCHTGNEAACYWDSYNHETLETFSQAYIDATNPPPVQGGYTYYLRRYSILRTEWYNGNVVKTRMLCVYSSYPIPTESENCMPRTIITGPDAGTTLPFPSDDPTNPSTAGHRAMITQTISDEWPHVRWGSYTDD